ncbi:MAG: class I SAM-dependent methyltransferase [Rickettsiales bacterium]|nr:class I SAM-dependent methyltransferase [Pseudomonadota bacterium]MDA0966759.1 class I SAM-dependent methyltransferase [Pseudomonadota bacterium]MDG4543431.1 class I SAM-dependent methyltransferase [Rickettsiales bacterium]MDG4546175.1 class I SAM-dependent methyltransferase [Rickettsiales bacterium]MDG4547648.1 class I SAM-dependent methyltransferase [Rickettsiales bacterium]
MNEPDEKNNIEFNAYKNNYSEQISEAISFTGQSHDYFTKVKADNLLNVIKKEFDSSKELAVLDIGCGHGLMHPFLLSNERIKLNGIDMADEVIEIAKKNNPLVNYDCYDGIKLPYDSGSFDMAYAICVMHHVPPVQWVDFLKEMKRVVKKGGLVVIFEHNPLNPVTCHIVNKCPLDENAVLLSNRKMKSLFKECGYEQIRSNYILFVPINLNIFRLLDKILAPIPMGAQYFTCGKVL